MDFNIKTGQPEKQRTNCLVLAIYESGKMPDTTSAVDKLSAGTLSKNIKLGDTHGKVGQTLMLHNVPNIAADRVLLVGCGKANEFNAKNYRDVLAKKDGCSLKQVLVCAMPYAA